MYHILISLFIIAFCVFSGSFQDITFPAETKFCKKVSGQKGTCKPINDCPHDFEELKKGGTKDICGFSKGAPIVCCGIPGDTSIEDAKKAEQKLRKMLEDDPGLHFELLCDKTYSPYGTSIPPNAEIGGFNAPAFQYPHMAALGFDTPNGTKFLCGGSLITRKFVLTAAHCLHSREYGQLKHVRLGDLNLYRFDDIAEPQNFTIIKRIPHPDYKPQLTYHDIAVVELDRPAKLNAYVKPACLDTKRVPAEHLSALGWGNLGFTLPQADHLQVILINEVNNTECRKFYNTSKRYPQGIVKDWQICAGKENTDTCQGDSGGPLQTSLFSLGSYLSGNMVIGVTSFGKPCGLTKSPGVYTRVSHYINWLVSICF